ncbi:hypothetical protein [Stetteria hydrogenophila]
MTAPSGRLTGVLGASGVLLMMLGVLLAFASVSLGSPASVESGYYYSATGLNYTRVLATEADNGTTITLTAGNVRVDVTPVFPPGASGNVTVMVSNPLSVAEVVALGASDPSVLGEPQLLLDIMAYWSVTGGSPTVHIDIQVPGTGVQAYYWDSAAGEWRYFPGQRFVVKNGATFLRLPVNTPLTGTPVAVVTPSPVGGTLAFHTAESWAFKAGLALAAAGAALTAAAVGLDLRRRSGA